MPSLDPGYCEYLKRNQEHQIDPTERGWVWTTPDGERHELIVAFGTVHAKKEKGNGTHDRSVPST